MNLKKSPFSLDNQAEYSAWRDAKLAALPASLTELVVPVSDPACPTPKEAQAIMANIRHYNFSLYRLPSDHDTRADDIKMLGHRFGLTRLDRNLYANEEAISELKVVTGSRKGEYIPYTDRALGWHTDGYYNPPEHQIRAFILHCKTNAARGGENALLDHELAYIHLRDLDPGIIDCLMQPDILTIPATANNDRQSRKDQTGPVFSIDPVTGALHMRYTGRKRHIEWKNTPEVHHALSLLNDLLHSDFAHILHYRLQPGEGLICNNILHSRTAFEDGDTQQRLMYRARYYDRVKQATTGANHAESE